MATIPVPTKDWPVGVSQIVCSRRDDPNRVQRPNPNIVLCADCKVQIVIHAETLRFSESKFPGLGIRTICTDCLLDYRKPDVLYDHRQSPPAVHVFKP